MGVFLHNNSKIHKDFPRMNLHEYQAKQLFGEYGIPLPAGKPATSVAEALAAADVLGGDAALREYRAARRVDLGRALHQHRIAAAGPLGDFLKPP